jgi:hypothetical protein
MVVIFLACEIRGTSQQPISTTIKFGDFTNAGADINATSLSYTSTVNKTSLRIVSVVYE